MGSNPARSRLLTLIFISLCLGDVSLSRSLEEIQRYRFSHNRRFSLQLEASLA